MMMQWGRAERERVTWNFPVYTSQLRCGFKSFYLYILFLFYSRVPVEAKSYCINIISIEACSQIRTNKKIPQIHSFSNPRVKSNSTVCDIIGPEGYLISRSLRPRSIFEKLEQIYSGTAREYSYSAPGSLSPSCAAQKKKRKEQQTTTALESRAPACNDLAIKTPTPTQTFTLYT